MEQTLLDLIKIITWPGVGALGILIIAKPIMPTVVEWIKSNIKSSSTVPNSVDKDGYMITFESLDRKISLLGTNHFHEVKDNLQELKDILIEHGRIQKEVADRTLVILTKMNGNRYK